MVFNMLIGHLCIFCEASIQIYTKLIFWIQVLCQIYSLQIFFLSYEILQDKSVPSPNKTVLYFHPYLLNLDKLCVSIIGKRLWKPAFDCLCSVLVIAPRKIGRFIVGLWLADIASRSLVAGIFGQESPSGSEEQLRWFLLVLRGVIW